MTTAALVAGWALEIRRRGRRRPLAGLLFVARRLVRTGGRARFSYRRRAGAERVLDDLAWAVASSSRGSALTFSSHRKSQDTPHEGEFRWAPRPSG